MVGCEPRIRRQASIGRRVRTMPGGPDFRDKTGGKLFLAASHLKVTKRGRNLAPLPLPDRWQSSNKGIEEIVIASSAPASGRSPWMKRLSDCRKFRPDFWLKIGAVSSLFPYKISPAKSTW